MYKIGLTGGIASGKSTVSTYLSKCGLPVVDADKIARKLAEQGGAIWKAYAERYGSKAINADGTLDRKKLGEIIFSSPKELEWVNSTTHPLIRAACFEEIADIEKNGSNIVILDIPLLFETGWQNYVDESWLVSIPKELQLHRIIQRDGLSIQEAEKRIAAQMTLEEKSRLADKIIDNSGSLEALYSLVDSLLNEVVKRQEE